MPAAIPESAIRKVLTAIGASIRSLAFQKSGYVW